MEQVRTAAVLFELEAGIHRLSIGAIEAGTVLERIRIYPVDKPLSESYLEPEESFLSRKTDIKLSINR